MTNIGFAPCIAVPKISARIPVTNARPRFQGQRHVSRAVVQVPTPNVNPTTAESSSRLSKFVEWFHGDFDNYLQVAEDRADEQMSRRDHHEHIHCRVTHIESERNLTTRKDAAIVFANYYYNGRPDVVYRQRMYEIRESPDGVLEMRIYKMSFIHGLRVQGCNSIFNDFDLGHFDDSSKYEYLQGAEVFWRYEKEPLGGADMVCDGEHFVGYMREGGWISEGDGGLVVKDNLILTKEDLWVAEEVYTKDGKMIAGNRHGIHHKMRRCRDADRSIRWTVDPALPFIGPP